MSSHGRYNRYGVTETESYCSCHTDARTAFTQDMKHQPVGHAMLSVPGKSAVFFCFDTIREYDADAKVVSVDAFELFPLRVTFDPMTPFQGEANRAMQITRAFHGIGRAHGMTTDEVIRQLKMVIWLLAFMLAGEETTSLRQQILSEFEQILDAIGNEE